MPGPWDLWRDDPWDLSPVRTGPDRYLYNAPCGWVARLSSGHAGQEVGQGAQVNRLAARARGIVAGIEAHLPPERRLSRPGDLD